MKSLLKKGFIALAVAGMCIGGARARLVYAQDAVANLETVGEQSGLGDEDVRIVIARLIRTGLSLLGVIAVCVVLYGGFVWMTSGGDAEKVERAKRILVNGGIGLLIILLSWSITTFIMTSILGAVNGTGGTSGSGGGGAGRGGIGRGGSSSLFEVSGIAPEGTQRIRNIRVQIGFTQPVNEETIEGAISIKDASGADVEGTYEVSGRRVTFTPASACPAPNENRFCFAENTTYTVTISEDIENTAGLAVTCGVENCSGTFTSGSVVDTEEPMASMTAPDDNTAIAADSFERVEVQANDDGGVASADFSVNGEESFATVIAEGESVGDVILEAIWETIGLTLGERYELTVLVTDVAGNTETDSVTVTARSATCFNGIRDEEETGVDCGGDSASAMYCGACEGSSCTEDTDCGGSAACEEGTCVSRPMITRLSPDNGAVGSFVTIFGTGFGARGGTVYVTGADGERLAAENPVCMTSWSDTEVIVQIPDGAGDGPITIVTARGEEDRTDDARGELVPDFDVNDVNRPVLCSVSPSRASVTDSIELVGQGFTYDRGDNVVMLEREEVGSYVSWGDERIVSTVPAVEAGVYPLRVVVDGVESNEVSLTVRSGTGVAIPSIVSVSPAEGAVGQYITIEGSLFGESIGSVWFENEETGERTLASVDFPDACAEDYWSDTEVRVIVPDVPVGGYGLSVQSRSGDESSAVAFEVIEGDPAPGLCAVTPNSAERGEEIVLSGSNFGRDTGSVNFNGATTESVVRWTDEEIILLVPESAETGVLSVENSAGQESNTMSFGVGEPPRGSASTTTDGSSTTAAGSLRTAAYAWSFSSGEIPEVPEVIVACSATTVSAVPNEQFSEEACVNAQVYVEFTTDMNEGTLDDALVVEKCTAGGDRPCSDTEEVAGTYSTSPRSVTFTPGRDFDVSTTYQVTVTSEAMSINGVTMRDQESWTFTTKSDTADCEVERVVVSPSEKTLTVINTTQEFSALPIADCNVLRADDYVWRWSVDESYAGFVTSSADCAGGSSACATVEALAEGTTTVTAVERASTREGSGELRINFSDPYIAQYFPNCTEACVNATVGAQFNIAMDPASVESGAELYMCTNELCTSLTEVTGASVGCMVNEDGACTGFSFTLPATLTPTKYYRVIVSGDVMSESGVPLIRTNYGDDFSWKFRVREDASVCTVERVALNPLSALSSEIGDQKVFTAQAYGEADACSVSGQLLDAYSYAWSWENPIDDEDNDDNAATIVAAWTDAAFADTDPTAIAEGCTTSCTSAGSSPYEAICGDGVLETLQGEECEDGNVANGDGCSSSCLREGTDAVTYACSEDGPSCASLSASCTSGVCLATRSGCGDGVIAEFEDCDDGNAVSGDGCSSSCLAEGSAAVGATCGNSDIAFDARTRAGEECDDGNARNNDGCSSSCTNEGTPTLASIGGAICGDGEVDEPYEACDDGNAVSGDGCSANCLFEGSSLRYASPSTCNDGVIGTGEECEDGNIANGDGCSSRCIREGSSARYSEPSYCGDGLVGTGEIAACEVGASGDGKIDPVQVAEIASTAVFEVSEETGRAVATVRSTETSSSFTAEADWTLFCAASSDADCNDPATQGVGIGSCCMDRPTVSLSPSGENVCRNAAIYGVFSQPMDVSDFRYTKEEGGEISYRMYAALDVSSVGGSCPSTHTTLVQAPGGIFARTWRVIKSLVFGDSVLATEGDCILPIGGYTQVPQVDSVTREVTYRVYMEASELMVAGGEYTLVVEGDDDITDGEIEGVQTRYGVGMNGSSSESFITGTEVCAVEGVSVIDTDSDNPGRFSSLDESHIFTAKAITYDIGGVQEVAPIEGVYDWTWSSWESDDEEVIEVEQDSTNPDRATVSPAGENGEANVTATLTIENNTVGIETSDTISGFAPVVVMLCENPWPEIAYYPWIDSADGVAVGAEEGIGWTNFSLGYCKDPRGSASEYLPDLTVVSPDDTQDDAILKEYLFQVQGSSDVIGVRIAANENYLSPMAWYEAQGFRGNPKEVSLDGFPAVEDGRTTYIAAPNLNDAGNYLYANMYIVSYNDNAGDEAQEIYNQIIENIAFAANVSSVGYCTDGTSYSSGCVSDLDCQESGESCADIKAKIARDAHRLADITDTRRAIVRYGNDNGYCSETTDRVCASNADCPGTETCEAGVPTLASGTFVRSLASSVWGSWNEILGGALDGEIGQDPLNTYVGCGEGDFTSYDEDTCVDELRGQYLCPEGSYAYHYRSYGLRTAFLSADLEYPNADWYYPIDENGSDDGVVIAIGNSSGFADGFEVNAFCDGVTEYGGSQVCGDGVVSAAEFCEVGQIGGASAACDSDGDGVDDGYINQICNSSCSGFEDNPVATCRPASCGNGIVEGVEMCDDGVANGRYGYCGSDCTMDTAMFCGDGVLSGGEVCDCGNSEIFSSVPSSGRAFGTASVGTCTAFNGEYTSSPNASCAWDCSGAASYCGDSEVTGSEQCDGTDDTWGGQLCVGGSNDGDACASGGECASGVCGGSGAYAACDLGYTRVMPCDDSTGASCTYVGATWKAIACTEIGSCGDGVVDPDEQCDDGNTDSTDACTAECTANICGDGYLYSGEEECDEGSANGGSCTAGYESTCSACTTSCRQVISSGAFCGDGVINGREFCDGSDIPYRYYDYNTTTGVGRILGACDPSQVGQPSPTNPDYTCRRLGMCNGGPENGEYCTGGIASGTGSDMNTCAFISVSDLVQCVFPTCADNCMSSCPVTQTTGSLLMTPNLPGSGDSASVDLYSYSSSSTSDLPNAATIVMPACNVAGTLTGTLDMSNVDLPEAYVVFVTDRSGSMSTTLGSSTRMGVAKDVLASAVEALYEGLGEDMSIALVGYSSKSGTGMCTDSYSSSCSEDSDCGGRNTCEDKLDFLGVDDEQTLLDRIDEYVAQGNTYTDRALNDAFTLLDAIPDDGNVRKIVVLLSDGVPTDDPTSEANQIKEEALVNGASWELYTVALTTDSSLIADMNEWSSNDGEDQHENGIDYSYSGSTTSQIEEAFSSIIDSILGITVGVISSGDRGVSLTTGVVTEGNNLVLPWPANFTCDPTTEQEIPIQLTFLGEGTVRLSNLRMEYCAP